MQESHNPETETILALSPGWRMGDAEVKAQKSNDTEMRDTVCKGDGDIPARGQHPDQSQGRMNRCPLRLRDTM